MVKKTHLHRGRHPLLRKNILGLTAASMLAGVGSQAMAGAPQDLGDMASGSGKGLGSYMSQVATKAMDATKAAVQAAKNHPVRTGVVLIGLVGTYVLYNYAKTHNFDRNEMLEPVQEHLMNFWEGLQGMGERAAATFGAYEEQINKAKMDMLQHSKNANVTEAWLKQNSGNASTHQLSLKEYFFNVSKTAADAAQNSLQKLQSIKPFSLESFLSPLKNMADQAYQTLPSVEGFFGSIKEETQGVQEAINQSTESFSPRYLGRKMAPMVGRLGGMSSQPTEGGLHPTVAQTAYKVFQVATEGMNKVKLFARPMSRVVEVYTGEE